MTSPLGKLYREISLTQGQIAIVSPEDYERLNQFTWFAQWADHTQSFYAVRNARGSDGGRVFIRMHREILGLGRGDNRHGDHISGDTLDNRRENLRIATNAENCRNKKMHRNNAVGLKGVNILPSGRFRAQIMVNGKKLRIGTFDSPEEAHAAYCQAAKVHHGDFARNALANSKST